MDSTYQVTLFEACLDGCCRVGVDKELNRDSADEIRGSDWDADMYVGPMFTVRPDPHGFSMTTSSDDYAAVEAGEARFL